MATTKICIIRKNINYSVRYIKNPDKINEEYHRKYVDVELDNNKKGDISKSIKYIDNPYKNEGEFVSGLNCTPEVAEEQFNNIKAKFHKKNDGILGFHFIQSFSPGESNPQQVHEIGIKLAEKITEGNFQAVISTHLDKAHLHNHIVINSVSFIDGKKYKNPIRSYKIIRKLSDDLCKEYGLSIVENSKEQHKHYKEWLEDKKGTSWKTIIKNDIDEVIKTTKTFEDFEKQMRMKGYTIKHGQYIAFKPQGKERFARGKTLGKDYTEQSIKQRIEFIRLGYDVRTFEPDTKTKQKKYKRLKRIPLFKAKSLLTLNIKLVIILLREIKKRSQKQNYSKIQIKYNDTLIQELSKQLEFVKSAKIENVLNLDTLIKSKNDKIADIRKEIKANETNKDVVKDLKTKYLEIQEEVKKYKKLKNDLDNGHRQIQKTRTDKCHDTKSKNKNSGKENIEK
jgi:hypothetical protein